MKLLLDQNLSFKLVKRLDDLYPGSIHVRQVGLMDAEDAAVWDYAKQNAYIIVSKDSDFHQRSFVLGAPPQVIWVRLGNCTTSDIERVLRKHKEAIQKFSEDKEAAFLSLS
jgi:predicted nuclease of predicted toxin-antitoxin system